MYLRLLAGRHRQTRARPPFPLSLGRRTDRYDPRAHPGRIRPDITPGGLAEPMPSAISFDLRSGLTSRRLRRWIDLNPFTGVADGGAGKGLRPRTLPSGRVTDMRVQLHGRAPSSLA